VIVAVLRRVQIFLLTYLLTFNVWGQVLAYSLTLQDNRGHWGQTRNTVPDPTNTIWNRLCTSALL